MKRRHYLLACAILSFPAAAWAMTADEVVQKTGIAGGCCSFPRAGGEDGQLAVALAKRPAFVVHLLSADAKVADALREKAEAEGLLGRSLYVEQGQPAPLPFADRMVDLLVVADLRDTDLKPELRDAWLRALSPRRGTALVGRPAAAGAGLSAEALKAWVKDLPLAQVVADDSGVWALLQADLPAGADPWTHRCHGADNSQVSSDTTFQAPFLAQWWALPRQDGFWGTTVVSGNSRIFTIRGSRRRTEKVLLTARSLTSGLVLWQKHLKQEADGKPLPLGGYVPGRACAVVAGDTLCLVDRDAVALLDGETGVERGRIAGPKPGGQIKWLAVSGNQLAVLGGDADVMQPITYQTVAANPFGRELAVYDLAAKKQRWHAAVAGDIDERALAIRDGRLYYLAQGVGVVACELATGKEVWKNPDAEIQAAYRAPDQKTMGEVLVSQPALLAVDDVVLLRAKWTKNIFALARGDGSILWKRPADAGLRAVTSLAMDGLWITGKGDFDLKTGLPAKGPKLISSGCGPTTAVPGYLITCFGSVADMKTGKVLRPADLKSPCDVGSLVSEGVLVGVASECDCWFDVKCYRAMASAGEIKPHEAPPWQERLTELSAAEPAALPLTDADWPTYRHDAPRSSASTATVGDVAQVLWHWKPNGALPYKDTWNPASGPRLAPDFLATAPVAAGGNVYFASHDGVIRCLKAENGKELWKFATGAMLYAPPTIWEGRLLAGGGDGRIYGLDATTGRPLWRLLAGPRDRRIFWLGRLLSTWPVTGGVVVKDGVGYAVAGYQAESGLHAYAFDPKTGKAIWEKHDAGARGIASGGGVAIANDKLCLAGWTCGSIDLKTGDSKMTVSGGTFWLFGSEVGALCNKWVLRGGVRLTDPLNPRPLNGHDKPGDLLPAWDADLVLSPALGGLIAVPADKYVAWKEGKLPAPAAPAQPAAGSQANPAATPPAAPPPKPKPPSLNDLKVWAANKTGSVAAFALTKDMAVVAIFDARKVVAFRRADGSKAWSVDLPEQPAMNRLAVDRDGRVLVALCDGSVIGLGKTGTPGTN